MLYSIHHLYDDDQDVILELLSECEKAGNPDLVYKFISTSKVSFPGSGIAAMAASEANLADARRFMNYQTIGHDKLNQLRHVRFFKDMDGIERTYEEACSNSCVRSSKQCWASLDREVWADWSIGKLEQTQREDISFPLMRFRDVPRPLLPRHKEARCDHDHRPAQPIHMERIHRTAISVLLHRSRHRKIWQQRQKSLY